MTIINPAPIDLNGEQMMCTQVQGKAMIDTLTKGNSTVVTVIPVDLNGNPEYMTQVQGDAMIAAIIAI